MPRDVFVYTLTYVLAMAGASVRVLVSNGARDVLSNNLFDI